MSEWDEWEYIGCDGGVSGGRGVSGAVIDCGAVAGTGASSPHIQVLSGGAPGACWPRNPHSDELRGTLC